MVTLITAAQEAEALADTIARVQSGNLDAVIAAGGDGTARLAAKAVAGTSVALGFIPLGTGNVLAHEIGLPGTAPELMQMFLHGAATPIETATANGELFLLMAGIGFDGRIIASLNQRWKQQAGKLAYVPPVLGVLRAGADRLIVDADGVRHEASWVVIANACCYGGAFRMAPRTHIRRPGLQAVLFHSPLRLRRVAQVLALARGQLEAMAARPRGDVEMLSVDRVTITSATPVPAQIDGDPFGTTPVTIERRGPIVSLIVPEHGADQHPIAGPV